MRLGINLRHDLKRRSDTELATELDRLIEYRKTRFGSAAAVIGLNGIFRRGFTWPFGRGPSVVCTEGRDGGMAAS